jgi:hypothetical protein
MKAMRGADRKTTDEMREVVKLAKANRAARLARYKTKLKAQGERIKAEAEKAAQENG